ncbi:hypothetical protein Nmel_008828 [Mimus melanotis]
MKDSAPDHRRNSRFLGFELLVGNAARKGGMHHASSH